MHEPIYRARPDFSDISPADAGPAERINDFIWRGAGLSNSFLIVTKEGRIVVNTGMGFEAPNLKAKYDAISRAPIRYILFTQGHVDHVGGADTFREPGTELVAQANNPACQRDDERIARFRQQRSAFAFAEVLKKAATHQKLNANAKESPQAKPAPTITFEDHLALSLGGLELELYAVPGGETRDGMAIWLPAQRICFVGNVFSALFGHFPNLVTLRGDRYRDALAFVDSVERVRALEADILLVGHHGPVTGRERIARELTRLRDAATFVHDETVRAMNGHGDLFRAMREIRLPRELEVGQSYGTVRWSVRAIWENYAGWFHQRSTTELYDVPASALYAELGRLADPAALLQSARRHIEADALPEALHLLEVALAAEPAFTPALDASLRVHRTLLERSTNFWEASWLRREIRSLEARRAEAGDAGSG